MSDKIFARNNPNADLFEVPTEEGPTEDDNYNASIGDATLKHVDGLGQNVVVWESFVRMPDGNLFAIEPNLSWNDSDEFNLRSQSDLQKFMKEAKIPEKYEGVYRDALAGELERREASEDVMDQRENLVSYEDWEANPGLSSHWDIPQTPKPHVKYVGNCHQMFYDDFPEDHPDGKFINSILMMLNREWDDVTPKLAYALSKRIENAPIQGETMRHLLEMVDRVANSNESPEAVAQDCLQKIDHAFFARVFTQVRRDELKGDAIYRHFNSMCQEFDALLEAKQTTVNKVYATIKQLGKTLFGKKNPLADKGIQGRMKKRHWSLYHKMKKRYAPKVNVNGTDINRAYVNELCKALGVGERIARDIIIARPFENLEDLRRTGMVSLQEIARQSPFVAEFLDRINAASEAALREGNVKLITGLPALFIQEQKTTKKDIPQEEWKNIWECYNNEKTRVLKAIRSGS